jgi:hypothetical protein
MSDPHAPTTAREEGKGVRRRMGHKMFRDGLVRHEMDLRGLTIRMVALKANVSPQSVRRAIDSMPMRAETAKLIWDTIMSHPAAAEGFAEAVQMEAAG